MSRRWCLLALLVIGLLLLASPAWAVDVEVTSEAFEPPRVEVAAGETVMWRNTSGTDVTIVGEDGSWDSGPLAPGETFSLTLREPGEVRYGTADGSVVGLIAVSAAPTEATSTGSGNADAALPNTGAGVIPVAVAVAAGLLAAGGLLLRTRTS